MPRLRCAHLLLAGLIGAAAALAEEPPPAPPVAEELIGHPAPAFSVTTVDGEARDLSSYEGYLLVLYFFAQDDLFTLSLTGEMEFFYDRGRSDEIRYLGVSSLPEERIRAVVQTQGLEHELAPDPGGDVTRRYVGEPRPAVVILDGAGRVRFFRDKFDDRIQDYLRNMLRELLRELNEDLRERPSPDLPWRAAEPAPAFRASDLEGQLRTSEEFRGKPLLVYFFEEDCTHCPTTTSIVRDLPHRLGAGAIQIVGIASRTPAETLVRYARDRGLQFPILLDPERRVRESFGANAGDPDLYWIDSAGNVRWRELGAPLDLRNILELEGKVLLGTADPAEFRANEYVGFRACRVCHEPQFRDWLATPHAAAYESVVAGAAFRRPECVACHVTGYRQPGGYAGEEDRARMSNVQCEACHGPAGGHPPETRGKELPWEARCLRCHTGPYVLKQSQEESLKWMSHRATPEPETLFAYHPERRKDMEQYRRNGLATSTFRRGTRYVGSAACAPCHEAIHDEWSASAHAGALETLRGAGSPRDPACLACHVTGPGSLTGYRGASTPALAGVGCESCHGPGGDHVDAPASMAKATIYGLAPDCPACQLEATCRACHDAANDLGFRMPEGPAARVHAAGR